MSEAVERIVNEHKDRWYAEGEEKGKADNSRKTALNLLWLGKLSVDEIAEATWLTADKVKELQKSLMS